jgi:hypothetical protein
MERKEEQQEGHQEEEEQSRGAALVPASCVDLAGPQFTGSL